MADNVTLNSMSGGSVVGSDEVTDATLGTVQVQYVKLMDGALNGTSKASVDATYGLAVDIKRTVSVSLGAALPAGSNVIGGVTQSGVWTVSGSVSVSSGTIALTGSIPTGANTIGAVTQSGAWNVGLSTGSNTIGAVTQSGTWNIGSINTLPALATGANTIGAVTQASGPWTVVERGATIAHGSASVTTSAAQMLASASTRRSVTIQNLGNDYVYIGATGITANNGIRLSPGQTLVIDKSPNAAIFAIAASGTQACSYLTESD